MVLCLILRKPFLAKWSSKEGLIILISTPRGRERSTTAWFSVPDSPSPPVSTVIIVYWMLMYRREQKILESVYANMFIISAVVN